jgi:hypothetical protein
MSLTGLGFENQALLISAFCPVSLFPKVMNTSLLEGKRGKRKMF